MVLIKSISGIRGTIGGNTGDCLTPIDIVKFSAAYAKWLKEQHPNKRLKVAVGRDARISGEMVSNIVIGTLLGSGVDVIDLGLSTTPTVEVAVVDLELDGGVILTASHNPKNWNALKLLNSKGEFISANDGAELLAIAEYEKFDFVEVDKIGKLTKDHSAIDKHIEKILALPYVNIEVIKEANFKVAVDCVNSTGGISIIPLLKALGVSNIVELYTQPTGEFPHNPEPLPEHLTELSETIIKTGSDVGFVVDPDVDRLAIVCEDGSMFGEEYTLVACADFLLPLKRGNTVSNLSSSRALKDITLHHGGAYHAAAVGEVNVVAMMKEENAVIGGEGNGGIILPDLHYGRDALVGIALFLTHLAKKKIKASALRATYPNYFIAKKKIELLPTINVDDLLKKMEQKYISQPINTIDGVKIEFDKEWVHLRKSNTEPIIRIYAESKDKDTAEALADKIIKDIRSIIE